MTKRCVRAMPVALVASRFFNTNLSAAGFSGQAQCGKMVEAHAAISEALHARDGAVAKMPGFFAEGGETAGLIARKDWRASALGAIDCWPTALVRNLRLCLESHFPLAIAWGPE